MTPQEEALRNQINNDQRVQQYARQNGTGFLSASDLKALGYTVPPSWGYNSGLARGPRGVTIEDGFWGWMGKYGIPIGATTLMGYGLGSLASGSGQAANASKASGSFNPAAAQAELHALETTPLGSSLPWTGSAAGAGSGAASQGIGGALSDFATDPSNIAALAATVGGMASNGSNAQSEEARRLNQITEQRMRRVDPLHQAITQLAWNRLPINSRQGITPPEYKPLG